MAILVITGGSELDREVVSRLVRQGDEVRVLESTSERRDEWVAGGVFVAVGDAADPDLVERAAQNARTIVVLAGGVRTEVVATALEAGPRAGVDRLVCCAPTIPAPVTAAVRAGPLDHVLIATGAGRLFRRKAAPAALIAEAVDAADDLAGQPRLELDLTEPNQLRLLGL